MKPYYLGTWTLWETLLEPLNLGLRAECSFGRVYNWGLKHFLGFGFSGLGVVGLWGFGLRALGVLGFRDVCKTLNPKP